MITCRRCGGEKIGFARGCCRECYEASRLDGTLTQYPRVKPMPCVPEARPPMSCLHCRKPLRAHSRTQGLCKACIGDGEVVALYPQVKGCETDASACRKARAGEEAEAAADARNRREGRAAGDPPWRCLYCGAWRCQGPLRICQECQRAYEEAAVGMPAWRGE